MSKFIFLKSLRELLTPLKRLIDKKAENVNWNENDPSSNSYIANRTHYKEKKEVFYLNNSKLFFENAWDNIYSSSAPMLNADVSDIFTITWDGIEYKCKVISLQGTLAIGNTSIITGEDTGTGEPFIWRFVPNEFSQIFTLDTAESHIVSCSGVSAVVHKIPSEYLDLPHDLITKSELASVAISGSYEDLFDTPNLNFVPYDSTVTVSNYQKKIARENIGLNEIDYNKLQNKPVGDLFYEQVTFNNLISKSVSFDPSIIFERKDYLISYTVTHKNGSTYTYSNVELNFNAQESTDTYYVYNLSNNTLLRVSLSAHTISITQWNSLFKDINLSIEDLKIERIMQLNEKFIPDTIARKADIPTLPESTDPHMQLVTDVDGNKVWEEKLCYRSGVLSLKLNSANASYRGESSSYGTYFESESTSNDPEQIAAFQAIGNSIYTNLAAQPTWTFYWDGVCYQTARRRLPVVLNITELGIVLSIFQHGSRGAIEIYYNEEGEHTLEFETLGAITKQLPYEFIPANVPVISEASAGQMVVVKAIDENGQPTAWETTNRIAVDNTLSISGAAADAKATNNAINSPKNSIVLVDQVNGYHYFVCMRDGNLVTYCAVKSIEVTTMPTKTEYFAGEYFDPSGMTIIAITYDGATKEITDFTYPSTPIANEDTYVEITYVEEGISYTVNVPVVVNQFDPTTALIDFEYVANENGTYTITGWKGTLNGESSTEMIIPDNGLIIV